MSKASIFSRFLRTKEKNGITAVFNSLCPKPVFFRSEDWSLFFQNKNNPKAESLLTSLGLMIKDKETDSAALEKIRAEYESESNRVSTLYLVLTHQCNYRCKYCFEVNFEDEKLDGKMMEEDTVKKSIDLFVRQFQASQLDNQRCLIILYGGEPLLNRKAVFYAINYIKRLQEKEVLPKNGTEVVIITNGSLIKESDALFFKENNVVALVSLDSPIEAINDFCRIDIHGKGAAERTIEAIKILKENNVEVSISVTITPYNVDSLEQFPDWLEKMGINSYGLNQLVCGTYDIIGSEMSMEEYQKKSVNSIISCFIKTRKMGIYEDRMERKIKAFSNGRFYPIDCGAYGQQIVVQPNGSLSICHADWEYNIGHVDDVEIPFMWNLPLVKEWKKRLPLYQERCLKCEAIGICGGGCAYCAKQCTGDIQNVDEAFCHHTKKTLDFLIWDLYEQQLKQADES